VTVALLQPGDASARVGRTGEDAVGAVAAVDAKAVGGADPAEVHPAQASNPAATHAAAAHAREEMLRPCDNPILAGLSRAERAERADITTHSGNIAGRTTCLVTAGVTNGKCW
jgi:hypothetical protein